AQHEGPAGRNLADGKAPPPACRDLVADRQVLGLREDPVSARPVEKSKQPTEPVVAVQPAASISHLHEPRPNLLWAGVNGHAECRAVGGGWNQEITNHRARKLRVCSAPVWIPS